MTAYTHDTEQGKHSPSDDYRARFVAACDAYANRPAVTDAPLDSPLYPRRRDTAFTARNQSARRAAVSRLDRLDGNGGKTRNDERLDERAG